MAIAGSGAHEEEIGGRARRLVLRNGEIERFEQQYDTGIFALWDQLFGRGPAPQVRHVRDLVALALVGGGMSDRAADDLVASLPPAENLRLRAIAQRALGLAFLPQALTGDAPPKAAGSPAGGVGGRTSPPDDMTPPGASSSLPG